MINSGEAIYYFEYLDHGKTFGDPKGVLEDPLTLWCVGKIHEESPDFLAVVCSGTKKRLPSSQVSYEIIYKQAITKQELVHVVE